MISNLREQRRILSTLRIEEGEAVVRTEDRFATDINDLWSALTDPRRLARWLGEVEGDLRVGGEFRASFFASGWEGSGRVDACEAPLRFVVTTREPEGNDLVTEARLTSDGEETVLVVEERGMPLEHLAGYGAGNQIHFEDLGDYLGGREVHRGTDPRWEELMPSYRAMAADVD